MLYPLSYGREHNSAPILPQCGWPARLPAGYLAPPPSPRARARRPPTWSARRQTPLALR